jgi:hypothetical protein
MRAQSERNCRNLHRPAAFFRQGRVGRFRHSASRDSTQISVTAGTVSSLRLYPQATPISKPVASMVALHRIDEGTGIEPGEPA